MTGTTYALLVGIDAYDAPVPELRGCVNDVEALAGLLQSRRTDDRRLDVRILRNREATRAAVVDGFRAHLQQAKAGDSALFYYSGHGAQAPAPPELWHVEPDHLLETLVLWDSRHPGRFDLADKELAALIADVSSGGAHVLVVLDCCHSGSGTRRITEDQVRHRLAPADRRSRPYSTFVVPAGQPGQPVVRGAAGWEQPAAPHVLLAACRQGQLAKEVTDAGRSHGAFSSALQTALREAGGVLTYRDIHRWATAAVRNRVSDQSPQLEVVAAGDLDLPFLGGAIRPGPAYYTVTRDDKKTWSIDGGAVHGVPVPVGGEATELAVFPLGFSGSGDRVGDALATARVTSVLPDRSIVELSGELDPTLSYRARVTSIPLPPMTIHMLGDDAAVAPLVAALDQVQGTLVARVSGEGEGDLVVRADGDGFTVFRPGAASDRVTTVAGPEAVERAVATVQHIARWMRLARLRNPATTLPPDAVQVTLGTPAGPAAGSELRLSYSLAAGVTRQPEFSVTLTNRTQRRLWCALVDLTETYGVFTDAFAAGSVELAPGESATVQLFGEVSDALAAKGVSELTDQLKVIVSTSEFDPRTMQQEELDVASAVGPVRGDASSSRAMPAAPTSTLERLMQRVTTRRLGARPTATEQIADWMATDVMVTVVRPST